MSRPYTIAIYPGTFDILHNGHMDVIYQAALMFNEVRVLVAENSSKKNMMIPEARANIIRGCFDSDQKQVKVEVWSGLTVDYALEKTHWGDRVFLIRGLRGVGDAIGELELAETNYHLNSRFRTIFIPCKSELRNLSTSFIKTLIHNKKDISPYCPAYVVASLKERGVI